MKNLQFYISAIFFSLFSRKFYANLLDDNNKSGFKYILILAVFLSLPITLEARFILSNILKDSNNTPIQDNLEYIKSQLPELRIKNLKFEIDSQKNVEIKSISGDIVAIFDVENLLTDLSSYEGVVVVNSNSINLMLPKSSSIVIINVEDISESLDQYFIAQNGYKKLNVEKLISDIGNILQTPAILIFIFGVFWFFLRYAISTLAYSFIAGAFLSYVLKNNSFDFKKCVRIAAFTSTPIALMELISIYLGGQIFSYVSLVYFITHMIYIHFAIESYKKLIISVHRI